MPERRKTVNRMKEEIIKKIKPGAKVKVYSAVSESSGEGGTSIFEGLVIARKHGKETGATFTVRSILAGVGVEKIFPINSPSISKLEVISSPKKIHRSKLYFTRKASGTKIRQRLGVSL
ncbi:MAG: 50S ribosomal protein L19 [Candidatus Liptonbacteria bacterium]|nr:50S ribosomal protein L19 [Candidatus Liptonbacteria bacterium]